MAASLAVLEEENGAVFDARRFLTLSSIASLLGMMGATAMAYHFAPLSVAIGAVIFTCVVALSISLHPDGKRKEKEEEIRRKLAAIQREKEVIRREIVPWLEKTQIEYLPHYSLLGSFLQQVKIAQEFWIAEKKKEALLLPLLKARDELVSKAAALLRCVSNHIVELENALSALRKHLVEKQQRERSLREIEVIEEQINELLTRSGAEKEEQFFERISSLATYSKLALERDKLEGNISELKRQLEGAPDLLRENREALEGKIKWLQLQEGGYRNLIEEKASIQNDIEKARKGHDLEEKRRIHRLGSENLEAKKTEFRSKMLAQFLLDEIEEGFKKEMRPDALKKADEYFQKFTQSAYAIYGVGDESSFLAFDCQQSSVKKLHELSRGTRIQLLLAIRLGFIASVEKEKKIVPLILDEAAAHADDDRWRAIAEVLTQEANEGRQILYFTCQQFVREAWKQICPQIAFQDLVKAQDKVPFLVHAPKSHCPVPLENETLSSYSERIGQPGLDFSLPATAQHIGHFLKTSSELHGLLQAGISTYGQVQKMHATKSLHPFLKPKDSAAALARGSLLETFLSIYRIGRPPSIEKSDLEEALHTGVLSDKFFDPLCTLMKEENGNANRILEALQEKKIKNFRTEKIEELRGFFLERGKLDPRPAHATEDLRSAFWEAYAAHSESLPPEDAAQLLDTLLYHST